MFSILRCAFERSNSSRIAASTGSDAAAFADADSAFSLLSCAEAGTAHNAAATPSTKMNISVQRESRSRNECRNEWKIVLMVLPCPQPANRPSIEPSSRPSPQAVQDSDLHPVAASAAGDPCPY